MYVYAIIYGDKIKNYYLLIITRTVFRVMFFYTLKSLLEESDTIASTTLGIKIYQLTITLTIPAKF